MCSADPLFITGIKLFHWGKEEEHKEKGKPPGMGGNLVYDMDAQKFVPKIFFEGRKGYSIISADFSWYLLCRLWQGW